MNIYDWNKLSFSERNEVLLRPRQSTAEINPADVLAIINAVKSAGDEVLIAYTQKFDNVTLDKLQVTEIEIEKAKKSVIEDAKQAILFAMQQIKLNCENQLPQVQVVEPCKGVRLERQPRPIECVGLYIPGGTAPLVSTVLMLGVPAQVAGCAKTVLCCPPNRDGEIDAHVLYAAKLCGITQIYKVGGAQAIAAMAYGTETIPKVDKIFGPGNAWVTLAKRLISQDSQGASIDMPAGPSEVMVIADENANPTYVACDLLSQAEHGIDSQVMLVTISEQLAQEVKAEIDQQLNSLPRAQLIRQALLNSKIMIVSDINQAIVVSNQYAPEHLILNVLNPEKYMSAIQHAGAVFLGPYAPETVGDYVTGSNHVLPTEGYARTYSGLSVVDFMKFINFQTLTQQGLELIGPYAEKLALIEGLQAHQRAVSVRISSVYNRENLSNA